MYKRGQVFHYQVASHVGRWNLVLESSSHVYKSVYYPPIHNACKQKTSKRYVFNSAAGMQNAGSSLKLPCKRTFKLKTDKTSTASGEYRNAAFGDNNPTGISKATANAASDTPKAQPLNNIRSFIVIFVSIKR